MVDFSQYPLGQAVPADYHRQFQYKLAVTKEDLAPFGVESVEAVASPASGFRMRAEFKIWHEGSHCYYAMYKQGEYKQPQRIDQFTIGYKLIQSLMPPLIERINRSEQLKKKLFSIEFLTSTLDDAIITLLYHKELDDAWLATARELASNMRIKVIGRSRKQKLLTHNDFIVERMELGEREYHYKQTESAFAQPNAFICREMLDWGRRVTSGLSGDLLELYCGNANFTIPLARNFRQVLATEISKSSVKDARHNIDLNKVTNINVVRLSAEEFEQAYRGERQFRRLEDTPLSNYHFSTVFVDPPRAGVDARTCEQLKSFHNIVYVSCNPMTLINDLQRLSLSHKVTRAAFFDQFPYTSHRECGVLLQRR